MPRSDRRNSVWFWFRWLLRCQIGDCNGFFTRLIKTVDDVFAHTLQDMDDAERQIVKHLLE
jgi:hypothetical protein